MNMDIWVVGTSNKLFIRGSYTETKLKKKSNYWQNSVLCDGSILHSPFSISFWHDRFVSKYCAFILSTFNYKMVLEFFKKGFCFSENLFHKVCKTFKTSRDCRIKTCWSLRRRATLNFFYKQPVYKQLTLRWQIAKLSNFQGSTLFA